MTEHFEIAPLLAALEQRREELKRSHTDLTQRTRTLQSFYKRLEAQSGCFDAEDLQRVHAVLEQQEAQIATLQTAIEALSDELAHKAELFERMHKTIEQRTAILEDDEFETILGEHDELLQFFASKQLRLKQLLQNKILALVETATLP